MTAFSSLSQILIVVLACMVQEPNACDLPPRALTQKPRSEYHGQYINEAYQYSIQIPDALTGYDQPTPPHHGFGILIGQSPHGYIAVIGEANSLEYGTPREAATRLVEYLRQGGKIIESVNISESRLDTLNAVSVVVKYRCSRSTNRYLQASTVALSPDKNFLYEITLYSPVTRAASDREILGELLNSWKYSAHPHP